MPNIFYGISSEDNVNRNIDKWISVAGTPDIFAVKEGTSKDFPTNISGYDVVHIDEALTQFPDANVWIISDRAKNAKTAGRKLLEKIQPDRIHFLEADLEYRLSCDRLGRNFYFTDKRVPMCTAGNRKRPTVSVSGTVSERITQWQDFTVKLINDIQLGNPTDCSGCHNLRYDFFPKTLYVKNLRFLQSLKDDACNFKCIYCSSAQTKKFMKNKTKEGFTTCDVVRAFSEIPEIVALGKNFTVTFSNGEFCANKHFDEIIDILSKTKWNIELLSNLSIYREPLAELMQTGRVTKIISSIDAGTRETFKKIKGNDRFDIVVENLKKYPMHKTNLWLKYLFLEGINDNEADVDGYYEIAKEVGAAIYLSTDKNTNARPFTENPRMRELVLRIIGKAKTDGLWVAADDNNINPTDVNFIRESYADMPVEENKMPEIIFYGIPSENNVRNNIDKWVSTAGEPKVFVEKDENLKKFETKLLGKYDVVSLDEALKRYPYADIWVTYRSAGVTARFLPTKTLPERIHFLEADIEFRKGCTYLGHFISYRKDNFSPCCVTGRCPVVKTSGSIRERLAHWQDYTEKLVDDIRHDRKNPCEKCHLLKYGFWRKSVKLREISFGSNNPGDVCNFKCVYCFSKGSLERLKHSKDGFKTYEVLRQLSEMSEYNTEDFVIQLSNGEFSVNKHCEEMLDVLLKTKWKIAMVTNLSVYREKLATLMESGRFIKLLVSLDAGTRETFKKVRGNDRFDIVVENLKKYPIEKANLLLKYIFLEGMNDNEADVNGFYEVVREVGCKTITLSTDQKLNFAPMTEKMRELTLGIIRKAKADGIQISANSSYLNAADADFIRDNYMKSLAERGRASSEDEDIVQLRLEIKGMRSELELLKREVACFSNNQK